MILIKSPADTAAGPPPSGFTAYTTNFVTGWVFGGILPIRNNIYKTGARREQRCMLHREGRHGAGARLLLFRRRAAAPLGDQPADPRRGPPHGGEFRQAAGTVAPFR